MTTDSTTTSTGREATPVEVSQRQAIENERFRQRIAELEAELAVLRAERWEPIPDGMAHEETQPGEELIGYGMTTEYEFISVEDDGMSVRYGTDPEHDWTELVLPANMRLCRKEARNE